MANDKVDRFEKARADWSNAVMKAKAAMAATKNPALDNLILAMGHFNHSLAESLVAISAQIEDIDRKVGNIEKRLDGKQGPFDLKMR